MIVDWTDLRDELAIWRAEGRTLPVWWRDDDAIDATGALDRLHALAKETGVPVHLAVIPRDATTALADRVHHTQMMIPVVHGWAHENHAPPELKKAEFGATRGIEAKAELQQALDRLRDLFGHRLAPMFVPPWNRIDIGLMPVLAQAGFDAVSTYLPRESPWAAPGLARINTHIDPIDWRGTRGLVAPDRLVALVVALLRDRRRGITDNAEPLGYLTHHLVHDADIWEASRQLLCELREGPITLYRHDERISV